MTGLPTNDEVGDHAVVLVVTDDGIGSLSGTQSFTITVNNTNDAPTFTGTPSIDGIARPGRTLSLIDLETEDVDGDTVTLTYQWCADGLEIPGATSDTFVITSAEKGKNITCIITCDDGNGVPTTYTTNGVTVKSFPMLLFIHKLVSAAR